MAILIRDAQGQLRLSWHRPFPSLAPEPAPDPGLVLLFVTVAGCHVELRRHDFAVHKRWCWCAHEWQRKEAGPGKPHDYETEHGFQVRCTGCGQLVSKGSSAFSSCEFAAAEEREARAAANEHAACCRALPPATPAG